MVEIDVYNDIANKKEGVFLSMFGVDEAVFSAETIKTVFANNKDESDFRLNLHCDGGSVSEGLAIYDIMRTSGKNIFCNIEGSCHSMAIVLLLAAPIENRSANMNAKALIHQVRAMPYSAMTADEATELANIIRAEENMLLDIYAERTGKNRAALKALMTAEKVHGAQALLDYGFISKINSYNTNKKTKKMTKPEDKTSLRNKAEAFVAKLTNFLAEVVNFDYADADGNVLFSTEAEDDTLAVGDTVTIPDGSTAGSFELPDGRVVTIVDNIVTEIGEAPGDDEDVENLKTENAKLREMLSNSSVLITDLKNALGSTYVPAGRTQNLGGKGAGKPTKADLKNEASEKRKKMTGGK